jgi:hypothetical protein
MQALPDDARQMLQQYRLENYNRLSLARVPGAEQLNSRTRDLYEALALPIDDVNIRGFLAMQFQQQQNFNREPSSPVQAAVLQTLDLYIHACGADATCGNSNLTDAVNLRLNYDRERFHASPHQVGHVLTSLGLDRSANGRTLAGYFCSTEISERGLHTLLRRCTRDRHLGEPPGLQLVLGPEESTVWRK